MKLAVADAPTQGEVAVGEVRFDKFGSAYTTNDPVLLAETVVEQPALEIPVMTTVFAAAVTVKEDAGILKVPVLAPIVKVAVAPVTGFPPVTL